MVYSFVELMYPVTPLLHLVNLFDCILYMLMRSILGEILIINLTRTLKQRIITTFSLSHTYRKSGRSLQARGIFRKDVN